MKRKLYTRSALALAALAASAALLLGACKATDSAGNTSAATAASKSQDKPRSGGGASPDASPKPADTTHADGIRRMRPEELRKMVEGGDVVIYDTRSKMSYDQEHIKGSLSMPHEEAAARAAEFPRDKTLVFYCT